MRSAGGFPPNCPKLKAAIMAEKKRRRRSKETEHAIADAALEEIPIGASVSWTKLVRFRRVEEIHPGEVVRHDGSSVHVWVSDSSGGKHVERVDVRNIFRVLPPYKFETVTPQGE